MGASGRFLFSLRLAWLGGAWGRAEGFFFLFVWLGSVFVLRLVWLSEAWGSCLFSSSGFVSRRLAWLGFFLRLAWLSGSWGSVVLFLFVWLGSVVFFVWLGSVGLGQG